MKTLDCASSDNGKIEFQIERSQGGPIPAGTTWNEKESKELFTPSVSGVILTGKLKAIHCAKCGILTGYRRYDVDMLCINCGQDILSERSKICG